MFVLVNMIISIVVTLVGRAVGLEVLGSLYGLAMLVPGLAVGARRLHDTGRSAWWLLIGLIPLIGWIWLIVLLVMEGDRGSNPYGADPKETAA